MSNQTSQRDHRGSSAPMAARVYDSVFRNSVLTMFVALMVLSSTGCVSQLRLPRLGIGDALLERYRDAVWARRAFNLRYNNCDIPYTNHFKSGFVAGYCQQCGGGDGYVPALPPEEYRGIEFQSADGAQCVKAWFDGFPAGVAAAQKDRAGEFHDIYTSKMINSAVTQENAKHVLPDDVPVLKGQGNGPVFHEARLPASVKTSTSVVPYAAPPEIAPNPILKPNALTPEDLMPAPKIQKSGPMAMKPASLTSKITIDPAVAVAGPPVPVAPSLGGGEFVPSLPKMAEVPIVRGSKNADRFVARLPYETQGSQAFVPQDTATEYQPPLPMVDRRAVLETPFQTFRR